ncbi:MAG: DUF1043 family protein [Natronospirillum sp.]
MFDWNALVIGLAMGAALGIVVTLLLSRKHSGSAENVRKQLDALKTEHARYQMSVTEHFARTSELIESLNNNYQSIEQHLKSGADALVSHDYKLAQLRQASDVLTDEELHHLGASRDYAPESESESKKAQKTMSTDHGDSEHDTDKDLATTR